MTDEERVEIERVAGHRFQRAALLECALTHRSFRANDASIDYNEQMEFLGDSVLGLVLSDYLFQRFPAWGEGQLSKTRARLGSARSLCEASRRLGLGLFLRLGPGEEKTGGREKRTLLANAYEALVAALFLDGGLEAAARFVRLSLVDPAFERPAEALAVSDHKSALQEWLQARGMRLAEYRVVRETGPDHAKTFLVEVAAGGRVLASCEGLSKKEAEQAAAARALALLQQETPAETVARG
ncbi:MAG TPA: ribonuclease III [Candidatus Acidoferrales bacterium]|nr:ribonuclease III [Candidatus Acidoferrales bacterium]